MFTILGGDGKAYGPVTADQVRAWISSGRANLDTKARTTGTDEWRRLGDFPEFGGDAGLPPLIGAAPGEPATSFAPSTPALQPAGRGARIGAALLNAFIYFLSMIPGSMIVSVQLMKQNPGLERGGFGNMGSLDLTGVNTTWAFAGFFLVVLVQLILIATRGQNLGKLVVGLRVVRADDGQRANLLQAGALRFLLPTSLIFLPYGWGLLGLLFLFVDLCFIGREDGRCLHDLIAGTRVVKC